MAEQKNPWTILSSEKVLSNDWIEVTHNEVLNPSGNMGIYDTVHFNNLAIGIIPIDNDLNTYLVGQFRFPLNKYSWEIPEGGGKLDIDPIESARRELLEETGIVAQNFEKIQEMYLSNSVTDEKAIIYLATGLSYHESNPDDNEQLEIKKVKLSEAIDMVTNGEITDSMSVAGLLKVQILINQNELKI